MANTTLAIPTFPGWHLLGAFPDGQPDDVGSWLLYHPGEAALLEIPPGLTPQVVSAGLQAIGCSLKLATASHGHEDHFDPDAWRALKAEFPQATFLHPRSIRGDQCLTLAGEPLWLIKAPKHSKTDVVVVFRGVAMTGDIELGMLGSVNREVPKATKRRSMAFLRDFQDRTGYRVHTVVSAHLNDVRINVNWPALFAVD